MDVITYHIITPWSIISRNGYWTTRATVLDGLTDTRGGRAGAGLMKEGGRGGPPSASVAAPIGDGDVALPVLSSSLTYVATSHYFSRRVWLVRSVQRPADSWALL